MTRLPRWFPWALLIIAAGVSGLFSAHRAGSEQVECTHGMGYYKTLNGWEPCPRSGPDGYYDDVVFHCMDCDVDICDGTSPWYNNSEPGDYACHVGDFTHEGHEVRVTATWKYDVVHDNCYMIIDEYETGVDVDLYFEFF